MTQAEIEAISTANLQLLRERLSQEKDVLERELLAVNHELYKRLCEDGKQTQA